MASLPSTITQGSNIEHLNNNESINENNIENNNNESYIFSNNENNGNDNNENENNENENNENENENENNSTITQNYPTNNNNGNLNNKNSNSNNENYPFGSLKNIRRKSRKMYPLQSKTRKAQRGGSKIPGVSNVVRITGTTLKKIGNVGIYGLKKVGNGVHVITHVVNKGVTAITGRNIHRGKTAKKGKKGKKQH